MPVNFAGMPDAPVTSGGSKSPPKMIRQPTALLAMGGASIMPDETNPNAEVIAWRIAGLITCDTDDQRTLAAGALWRLTADESNLDCIRESGGIAPLIALATNGTPQHKAQAAGALANLSLEGTNKVAIGAAGGIVPLVALAARGIDEQTDLFKVAQYEIEYADEQKTYAAGALRNLATEASNLAPIREAGGIEALVALSADGTDGQREHADAAIFGLSQDATNKLAIAEAFMTRGKRDDVERARQGKSRLITRARYFFGQ